MEKAVLQTKVAEAEQYITGRKDQYSITKNTILRLCLTYAKEKLVCQTFNPAKPPKNRYDIYSNIINNSDHFDDVYFLAYVVQEIKQIRPDEGSDFRATILTLAEKKLALLLIPEIKRTRLAFAGLVGFGTTLLYHKPQAACVLMLIGVVCVGLSENIVYQRLKTSLHAKMLHLETGGLETPVLLTDGFEDVFGRFANTATGMLENGITLFERSGARFQRLVGGVRQPPRVEVLAENQHPENPYLLSPAPSAPPAPREEPEEKEFAGQRKTVYN